MQQLAADAILLVHFGFVLFVVLGGLLVWKWRRLAWLHLPAVLWGALIEFSGWICPLTPLENRLRGGVEGGGYPGSFIERYLLPVIYPTELTRELESAITAHPPPLVRGRRIKLRYAHQGGRNPPVIVIHGNQTDRVPESYRRYLINHFRKVFKLRGTPVRLQFKSSDNPYKGRRNKLTPRQERRRKRLMKRVKK